MVADIADSGEQLALEPDAFQQGAFLLAVFQKSGIVERMQAAGFGEALHQRLGLGVQKQHMHVHFLLFDLLQQRRQSLHAVGAAHVYADRDVAVAGLPQVLHQRVEQVGRKIVHAVITAVFQHVERNAFAGTG
jgi:hypothetical protein